MGDRAAPQGMWGWAVIGGILLAGVLVPFALVEAPVERLSLAALAADLGALGMGLIVAALLALDLVLPVPSSLVATSAGYLLGPVWGSVATWIGLSLGAAAGYGLGRYAEPLALRIVGPAALARARELSARHGLWIVVVCRPVPVLAEATAVLAGINRLEPWAFALQVGASNLGIALAYAWIGGAAPGGAPLLRVLGGAVGGPLLAVGLVRVLRAGKRP